MDWRRVGGHGIAPDGAEVTWSAAEGRRGTRWRESAGGPGGIRHVLLLEIAPSGRPTRLEIAGPDGILTLHPEPDDSAMHGNVVTSQGVVHVTMPWSPTDVLLVPGSPTALSAVLSGLARDLPESGAVDRAAVVVEPDLRPRSTRCRIQRVGDDEWRIAEGATVGASPAPSWRRVATGPGGDPGLVHATTWPLER